MKLISSLGPDRAATHQGNCRLLRQRHPLRRRRTAPVSVPVNCGRGAERRGTCRSQIFGFWEGADVAKSTVVVTWRDRVRGLREQFLKDLGRVIVANPQLRFRDIAKMYGVQRKVVGIAAKLRGIEPKLGLAHPALQHMFRPSGKNPARRGRIKWMPKRGVVPKGRKMKNVSAW